MWCARAWAGMVVAAIGAPAIAQSVLYGVSSGGDLIRIDPGTGAGTLIGNCGFGSNDACADNAGHILSGGGPADQIIAIDPATGAGSVFLNTTGRPFGYGIRGMTVTPSNVLYVVLSAADVSVIDTLARIDISSGVYTVIGPTGRTDLQALASSPTGDLYALGINLSGQLFRLDPTTGAATLVGGGGMGGDTQALTFMPDGTLYASRSNLLRIDPATGGATVIGATGSTDLRGMAVLAGGGPPPCYANCDGSTASPVLNVADFTCFLQKFSLGDPYANCDGSTGVPLLNVADFTCFLQKFAQGCP
jgi:streptogramin lyase